MPERKNTTSSEPTGSQEIRRLGKNLNGYLGETIDIDQVLTDCVLFARNSGWAVEEILKTPHPGLLAFTRCSALRTHQQNQQPEHAPPRIYISAGIHGDEPASPLAVRQLLQENQWPMAMELWLIPCLNPAGFRLKRRENQDGLDLNRQYLVPKAEETLAHIAWLERQPSFTLCLCLHEDWEANGFYVYELNPDGRPSIAEDIVNSIARVCPIDRSEMIEGRPAHQGIIRPSTDPRSRPDWPEAFYLLTHKTRLSYTLEAPSDFPLPLRVTALVTGVLAALKRIS